MRKLLTSLLLIMALSLPVVVTQSADTHNIEITTVTQKSGIVEVTGHVTGNNVPKGTQVSFVMADPDMFDSNHKVIEDKFNMDYLAHLNQASTGNNGTFLLQFTVDSKWSEKVLAIALNTSLGDAYTYTTVKMPELPPGIDVVGNNSVLYGRDIFSVEGKYYTPDNIANAMLEGNNIYFKIGDNWYNLMDAAATSNAYLISKNAVTVSEVENLKPNYYYTDSQMELRYKYLT